MAQASGLKGRWSGHGEDERHLGWCRSTVAVQRSCTDRYKAPAAKKFVGKIGARKANARKFLFLHENAKPPASGPRTKEALSTGWAARLCCEQRGRLAAVSSQPRGVRQRVQAVGSARECARERATRERSGSQSSSVYACGHSPRGAIARVLGPTQWSSIGGCCSRPRTNAEMIWCKCSRPMGQRTFGVRMRVSRQRPRRGRGAWGGGWRLEGGEGNCLSRERRV